MEEEIQLKLAEVMMDYYVDGNGQTLQDYIIDQCNKSEDGIFSVGDGMFSTVDGELSYTDSKGNTSIISIGNNGEVTIEGGISSDGSMNDNKAPSISATSTTNSITFVAKDILAGVAGWNYSTTNSEPTSWNEIAPAQKSFTHTINNLTNNTTYYIWAKDANGNVSSAKEVRTTTIAELTMTVKNADTWTKSKEVTIVAANSNYKDIKYTTNGMIPSETVGENIKSGETVMVNSNCTIYAVALDSTNQAGITATCQISTIDNLSPQIIDIRNEVITTSSIELTVNAEDREDFVSGKSGIIGYRFSKDGGNTWTDYQTNNSYKFTDLIGDISGETYPIQVEVKDFAGNTSVQEKEIATVRNNAYYVAEKDKFLGTVNGREYYKTNSLPALASIMYRVGVGGGRWVGPALISTNASAVETRWDNTSISGASESFEYHNKTYWINMNASWQGNPIVSTNLQIFGSVQNYIENPGVYFLDQYFYGN